MSKGKGPQPVIFIGPAGSGRKTAMMLLHEHSVYNREKLGIESYTPVIRPASFDFYRQADDLMNSGVPPPSPPLNSFMIELNYVFAVKGPGFEQRPSHKRVRLVFSDISSETFISAIQARNPSVSPEVSKRLRATGLSLEDIYRAIRSPLEAKGFIVVADASKIGTLDEDPDPALAYYLNGLIAQIKYYGGSSPKGIGLLLTKFERVAQLHPEYRKQEKLKEYVQDRLPNISALIEALVKEAHVSYQVFYSGLEKDESAGEERFKLNQLSKRIQYDEDQYTNMLNWIRDTF